MGKSKFCNFLFLAFSKNELRDLLLKIKSGSTCHTSILTFDNLIYPMQIKNIKKQKNKIFNYFPLVNSTLSALISTSSTSLLIMPEFANLLTLAPSI